MNLVYLGAGIFLLFILIMVIFKIVKFATKTLLVIITCVVFVLIAGLLYVDLDYRAFLQDFDERSLYLVEDDDYIAGYYTHPVTFLTEEELAMKQLPRIPVYIFSREALQDISKTIEVDRHILSSTEANETPSSLNGI